MGLSPADGQDLPASTKPLSDLGGSVGVSVQTYGTSLDRNRRAPFESRVFANSSFRLFGMPSGFRLSYSTDESSLRQSMNRIALRSTYDWRNFTIGDASPTLSRYSVRGATVRGAMVQFEPGHWTATLVGGRSKRAVDPSEQALESRNGSFRRMLYAMQFGYNASRTTFARLTGVYGKDVNSSLHNTGDLKPAENASLTPQAGVSLLDGRLDLKAEMTASAFTPDTRAAKSNDDAYDVPFLLSPFIGSREGTYLAYASQLSARWNDNAWGLMGSLQRVDAGFESLGIEQTRSDQQVIRLQPRLRLADGKVNVTGQYSNTRDNLDDQLPITQKRSQLGLQSNTRFDSGLSFGASFLRFWATTDGSPGDTLAGTRPEPVSNSITVSPAYVFQKGETTHTTSLTTTYQKFSDAASGSNSRLDSKNWSGATNYAISLPSTQTFSVGINWVKSTAQMADVSAFNLTLGAGRTLFEKALTLDLVLGFAKSSTETAVEDIVMEFGSNQYTLNLSGLFRLGNGDSIRMNVQGLSNHVDNSDGSFDEIRSVVRYEHRF